MKHASKVNMSFVYTSAAATNVAKTIARERKRLAEQKAAADAKATAISIEQAVKVHVLKGAK